MWASIEKDLSDVYYTDTDAHATGRKNSKKILKASGMTT